MKSTLLVLFFLSNLAFSQQYFPPPLSPYEKTTHGNGFSCENLFIAQVDSFYFSTLFLLDKNAEIQWYSRKSTLGRIGDFKVHPDGMMSFMESNQFFLMDSTFQIVDSISPIGYTFDTHDLIITPNQHYIILAKDYVQTDLSSFLTTEGTPGFSGAIVMYNVIQELDANKNLVKNWNGFQHFPVASSDLRFFDNPNYLESMHSNAIDLDENGNILLSSRHYNEVTSIDWDSGDLNWRLGGAFNEFTFLNDSGFTGQHDSRFLPGGRISVFDNGATHTPPQARGVIYQLDTVNMTAEVVWKYAKPGIDTSKRMGSFRVQDNGDAVIGWGAGEPQPYMDVSYVRADSSPVMDLQLGAKADTYRAICGDLPFTFYRPEIVCNPVGPRMELSVLGNHASYQWSTGETTPTITISDTGSYQVFVPYGIGFSGSKSFRLEDPANPCLIAGIGQELRQRRECIGMWDLLGREVVRMRPGQVYVLRYSDGSCERVVVWE